MKVHNSDLFTWNSEEGRSEFSTLGYAPCIFPNTIAIKSSKTGNIEIFERKCTNIPIIPNLLDYLLYFPKNTNLKNKNGELYKIRIFND